MLSFLISWAEATWQILVDSALYFLIGLILAGLVWLFLNERTLRRLMGRNRKNEVFRAALIGVPLPLCSCSVLPVAGQLRSTGMSRGGTVSFLIATPESSVDSILLTYSLTDPLLTVARPVAAFLTATLAGLFENAFDVEAEKTTDREPERGAAHGCDCGCLDGSPPKPAGMLSRIGKAARYSFTTLVSDLAPYLFSGYLLAGLAAVIFGSMLQVTPAAAWWAYVLAVIVGVPLYVCATSSTPLAAVLLGAGFPPGAILVFLLTGPATNFATISVVRKIIGAWPTVRYVGSIVVVALLCGFVLDWLYGLFGLDPSYRPGMVHEDVSLPQILSAFLLGSLILWHSAVWAARRLMR